MSARLSCDDVTRDLSEGRDHPALGDHLAACPACARFAARHAALTRLWDATRPVEPPAAAWNSVWATVSDRLDRASTPAVLTMSPAPRRWGRPGVRILVAAQAAAVLAGVVFLASNRHAGGPAATPAPVPIARVEAPRGEFEFDPGEIGLIRDDGNGLRAVTLAQDDRPFALDRGFDMYNAIEALAE
jgi:hypothetical protein